jgi:iron complex outermembrane receptor protein
LILINGKRKKRVHLVYTKLLNVVKHADISAIPTDAIERVENLRDGLLHMDQMRLLGDEYYLEKSTSGGSVTLRTGITGQGDGEMYGVAGKMEPG